MTKALLVDYGGVLTTSVLASFGAFCEQEGLDIEVFRKVVLDASRTTDSPFARVEIGAITQEQFDVELAELLSRGCGREVASQGLKQRLFAAVQPDTAMIEGVRRARAQGVRTALVSNSWGGGDYPMDALGPLFDVVVISGDVGLRKPDPEIFALAVKRLDVEPRACVFVDDFKVNVDGARAVGMEAVLHRSADETLPQLERFLEVPLRAEMNG